jgi:hypothetical protein
MTRILLAGQTRSPPGLISRHQPPLFAEVFVDELDGDGAFPTAEVTRSIER